jgi:hypothetical protein
MRENWKCRGKKSWEGRCRYNENRWTVLWNRLYRTSQTFASNHNTCVFANISPSTSVFFANRDSAPSHMSDAPVLVVRCVRHRVSDSLGFPTVETCLSRRNMSMHRAQRSSYPSYNPRILL